ncbi:PREDICTED: protein S100-A15A [Myotis davidii]|uniref:Protein S100-A15A n=1 Tax=Myotis davidii TaxID=225400 RepID=L5MEZ6_MYODS|nr:PREDICTED: protein S100-A15A [Myotis davidii]ELK36303.1 Protein S100-A15A [Myotis davidii]
MSHTPVEQSVEDLIVLFHKYTKPDDKIDKPGLLKMLKENFPNFLKACGREKPYFVTELFRAADKDKDNQICFDEFLYVLGQLLRDYHLQYHRQLCAHYCAQHSLY